jgi:hypothetical protein
MLILQGKQPLPLITLASLLLVPAAAMTGVPDALPFVLHNNIVLAYMAFLVAF